MTFKQELLDKIAARTLVVGIVGLGYVGLPLAVEFGRAGVKVIGVDLDARKVTHLQQGKSYIPDVPSEQVHDLVSRGLLTASTDYAALQAADAISICVPTPLNAQRGPDMGFVIDAADRLQPVLHPGLVIALESTVYPGATEDVFLPRVQAAGLRVGEDVFVSFSPERIDPGNARFGVRNTPKVVGGITPACVEVVSAFYALAIDRIVPVTSVRASEMVKLLENTFRAVNIGLVNEMALMCERLGVNVWEVVDAANTKPYGFMKFTPGPGLGGHCLVGGEFVFVRHQQRPLTIRLQDLVARLEADPGQRRVHDQPDTLVLAPGDLDVLTFDLERSETCYRPVQFVSRRAYSGPMVEIQTVDGRRVVSTDGHPMLIWEHSEVRLERAATVRPGQELLIPLGQPEQPLPAIDLLDWWPAAEHTRVGAMPADRRYADYAESLWAPLQRLGLNPQTVFKQNTLSLVAYHALERAGQMPIPHTAMRLTVEVHGSIQTFPAVLAVNDVLARVVAYYLAAGRLAGGDSQLEFAFAGAGVDSAADLKRVLEDWEVGYEESADPGAALQIRVVSEPLVRLIRDVLQCGVDAASRRAPDAWLQGPETVRRAFLATLLHLTGEAQGSQFFGQHPVLFQQATRLKHGLGYGPGDHAVGHRATAHHALAGLATVVIRDVAPAAPVETVYSLEVEGTHTFVTSDGLLVHNCIPIDPLYLSWKMRELGYTARFIETADVVNTGMPEHAVHLVVRALNDDGKALKGTRVLVLGVAYKKDIDDLRESPALEVLALLRRWGAQVEFHDPHIASLRLGAETLHSVPLAEALRTSDCVVVTTDHTAIDWAQVRREARLIVDTRNALAGVAGPARVVRL